ncbi:zinc finger Y-chromosomal protein-like [Anthonomus grandis grandis]|uniref:zinc finger Y-chromosomal protein-like n=1 Tax=Anthonomus grandis grandis TaxID=2921223 RepID=UPI00216628F2|nr:zinc finger Y-chromosomal protein-like [Anthonomus grandis grandis]
MRHKRDECEQEPKFCCIYCSYKAKQKGNLKKHVNLIHKMSIHVQYMHTPYADQLLFELGYSIVEKTRPTKIHLCFKCQNSFGSKKALNEHENICCREEQVAMYRCGKESCIYASPFKKNVALHIKYSHKSEYEEVYKKFEEAYLNNEEETDNTFKEAEAENSTVRHLKTVGGHDAKDMVIRILKQNFSNALADICSWTGRKGNYEVGKLKQFDIMFEQLRRFKCLNCDRAYKNRGHLSRHLKFECGQEKQFYCEYCSFKTHRKETLKAHVEVKHIIYS